MRTPSPLHKAFGFGVLVCATAVSPARAVTTAATDPVGFTTLTASSKTTPSGEFNLISLNLTRPISFQGAVPTGGATTDSNGRTVITFSSAIAQVSPSYAEIASGASAGVVSDIVSATSTSITLADNISVAAGTLVKIRPHWTFSTAFGVPNQGDAAALTGGSSVAAATSVPATADILTLMLASPANSKVDYYFNTSSSTWRRVVGDTDASNEVIPLNAGIQVQRHSQTPANIVVVGAVKLGPTGIWVGGSSVDTTTLVGNPYPLPSVRLDQTGLYNSSADPNATVTLAGGSSAADADVLRILDPQTGVFTDFYYDNTGGASGNRWKSGYSDASLYTIPAGASAQIVRKANRPSFVWYAPQPTMQVDPNAATPALAQLSAVSRKTHGAALLDVNLPLSGAVGIENRGSGGTHSIVVEFSNPVVSANAAVSSGTGSVGTLSISGRFVTIPINGASDGQKLTIGLTGVTDSFGQVGTGSATIGLLAGDVNGGSTNTGFSNVNIVDMQGVKNNLAVPVSFSNFRADMNLSNTINIVDMQVVKNNLAHLVQ